MKGRLRFAAWTLVAFAALLAPCGIAAALLFAGLAEPDRAALARIADEKAPLLAFLALILLLASAGAVRALAARYLRPLRMLAEQARVAATLDAARTIRPDAPQELVELAAAVDALAEAHRARRSETDARIAESGVRLAEERNRLAALVSDLSEGILLCDARGRILLYNERARELFTPAAGPHRAGATAPVGLGRSLFGFLDRDQVAHAMDKIQEALERGARAPRSTFLAAAPAGRLVRARLSPYLSSQGEVAGMVLGLGDATEEFGAQARRGDLLVALGTEVRQSTTSLRAAAENLVSFPAMKEEERARFTQIVAFESRKLSESVERALGAYADAAIAGLALERMRLADLLRVARRHIAALPGLACRPPALDAGPWVKVDSFALVRVFASIARRLRDERGVHDIGFAFALEDGLAAVDLEWDGPRIDAATLGRWESDAIEVGSEPGPLTIRDVLGRHGGELGSEDAPAGARLRLRLPVAEPPREARARRAAPGTESRPEYYDFDLFGSGPPAGELGDQPLSTLAYTAFDTETTGLEPSAGDRIVSIGAVRIVNGRLLRHEVFDQLVDPERSVSRESALVHGLRRADLAGQPVLREVLPAFHAFCEDSVLVAHNAAFDMRFLELAQGESGVRFTQPVLDTLLLSAVVHPGHEDHRLEAIAERLGVPVIGRHTALGDALVTGEVFLRLVALLAQHGVVTLAQALAASRRTYHVRLQY
jgi:DNA polymerase-3 subunit epsilon